MTTGGVTTSFLLDRQNVVQEIRNGSPVATCLVGPRGVEYRQDASSGERRWYIYDGLGSVLAEVDQDGKVNPDQQGNETPLRKYDVYGAIRNSQEVAPGTSSHKFVGSLGHTSENESGLIYMRARYYDPAIGRFISQDPGRNGENWYAYCNDNPVTRVDTDGRFVIVAAVVAMIIGAALGAGGYAGYCLGTGTDMTVEGFLVSAGIGAVGGLGVQVVGSVGAMLGFAGIANLGVGPMTGVELAIATAMTSGVGGAAGALIAGGLIAAKAIAKHILAIGFALDMTDDPSWAW